jgi:hypothetical protein
LVVGEKELKATSTNISESGIALMVHHALPKNATARLQFTLPRTSDALDMEAEVAWADLKGHAGLRFVKVPASSQQLLENWLGEQIEKQPPAGKEKQPGSGSGANH